MIQRSWRQFHDVTVARNCQTDQLYVGPESAFVTHLCCHERAGWVGAPKLTLSPGAGNLIRQWSKWRPNVLFLQWDVALFTSPDLCPTSLC